MSKRALMRCGALSRQCRHPAAQTGSHQQDRAVTDEVEHEGEIF